MKISAKIIFFVIAMIIVSVSVIAGLSVSENAGYNETISYERVASAANDLTAKIAEMQENAERSAVLIAQNFRLVAALEKNSFDETKAVLDDINRYLKMDTISITDNEGNIVIRQHEPAKSGDSILKQSNVQNALKGEVSTTLEPGALVRLSCRSGAPIYNAQGAIIGTVVTGFTFENAVILDELKVLHNTELTIFSGTESIATTIMQDGQRVSGMTLDGEIAKTVLESGNSYTGNADVFGEPYITKYDPLRDTKGNVVGAIFSGMSKANALAATAVSISHMVIAALIIIAICALILLQFVNRSLKRPMLKLTKVSRMLA